MGFPKPRDGGLDPLSLLTVYSYITYALFRPITGDCLRVLNRFTPNSTQD
jgi:hypothetical protein